MVEITKIGRLDGKNYQSWKYDIKFVLMEHGLWRFVEGTETAPGVSVAVTVQNASDLPSHKAYSLRGDVSKYRPEVYKSEKSKILKKVHKVALGKLLT